MIIGKKYLFYIIAITSAFIAALVTSIDSFIGGTSSFVNDPYAFGFAIFFVGFIVTFLISLFLSIPFRGKSIGAKVLDPSFRRLRMIQKSEIKYHLIAGLVNAINTVAYCYIISTVKEPSIILSFSQVVIIYLLFMESVTEKDVPTLVEIESSVIVVFGAILSSISLSGTFDPLPLAVVFLIVGPTWAIFSIYQRKLKLIKVRIRSNDSTSIHFRPNDSINIRFWNVLFSFIFTSILILVIGFVSGQEHLLAGFTSSIKIDNFQLLGLTMSLTFFAYVLFIRALGLGKASVNNAIRASEIIFAVPFSIILALYFGGQMFPTDPTMIIIKVIGMVLIIFGIVSFAFTVVKSYIFVNIKPGCDLEETMKKLWDIRGVTHVTVTSGRYDFIVKVSTRTLVKGYEKIIRKIEEIPEIKKYRWASVLRDWENI